MKRRMFGMKLHAAGAAYVSSEGKVESNMPTAFLAVF